MKKVDQFFKNKFENQEFEFKDDYWADAQKLIEADQKRRRRGGWLPWFLGIALLGVLSGGMYWVLKDSHLFAVEKDKAALTLDAAGKTLAQSALDKNKTAQNNSTALNTSQEKRETSNKNEDSVEAKKKLDHLNSTGVKTTKNTSKNNAFALGTQNSKNINLSTQKGRDSNSDIVPSRNNNSAFPNLVLGTSDQTDQKTDTPSETNSKQEGDLASSMDQARVTLSTFDLLELKSYPLLGKRKREVNCNFFDNKKRKRWALSWNLYTLLNTRKGTDYFWLGAATGPGVQYKINKRLAIQTEVLYRWRRGHFNSDSESKQKTYGFGLVEETFRLNASALHQLDWPIYLQVRNRRQSLEGGISVQYNFGTKGDLTSEKSLFPWQRNPGANSPKTEISTVEQSSWIKDANIRPLQLGVLLGYRYQMNKKISIGMQARYELLSVYKVLPLEGNGELDGSPIHIQAGLTFYPFR